MNLRLLLIADIHGNFPALEAIDRQLDAGSFQAIINSGDSLVYAPFPNETLDWLQKHRAISILGNTDRKVIKLLLGKSFHKPKKPEKRVMYTSTAEELTEENRNYLLSLNAQVEVPLQSLFATGNARQLKLGIFHGSPADPDEFLFAETEDARFTELAALTSCDIVVTGHSHSAYHKQLSRVHFINPGSVGRMFDGDPRASCAVLEISARSIRVHHFRIPYDVDRLVLQIRKKALPEIYATMFLAGKKLN